MESLANTVMNEELEAQVAARTQELATALQQIGELAERMTLATDAARMGTFDWNLVTHTISWNENLTLLLGYVPGAIESSYANWECRVHSADLPRVEAQLKQAMNEQTDYSSEYRVIWLDGSSHWLAGFGRFYYDRAGKPVRMAGIIHDITDRIQMELAIKASEARFRSTFEQAAVGVAHVGVEGQWLQVNQKLCDILGYTEAELRTTTFQDITHPDDLAADIECVHQILAGTIQTYTIEKRYIHKLGQIIWVNLTVSLLWDNLGTPIYFISVIEDINDRKQAEFTLQQKTLELAKTALIVKQHNQDLEQFAHIVSHDLKAPLRAISNLATWIEDDLEGQIPAETQEHFTLMRSRVTRMEGLINGLLEYAKVGNTPASLTTFKIEDLLAEIIDSLSIPPSFAINLPTNLPTITTHRILLSQVLANLLGNACKHHDRTDGKIQVTAQHQGKIWAFTVADDGAGIAPENQERVFGVFQTLAARDHHENTGIGLSIVKKIVESQGGNISLESELGRGTTFRFTWIVGN